MRFYSEDVSHMPDIKDPKLQNAFKELMATSWDEIPHPVIYDVKQALSENTDDKAGKDVVENVFRAAEAVEEFGGILVTLKLEIDDSIGASGEVCQYKISCIITNYCIYLSFTCCGSLIL